MDDKKSDIENLIQIEEDEVNLSLGATQIKISGIISKRHAQILVAITLAMLGYHHEVILGMV